LNPPTAVPIEYAEFADVFEPTNSQKLPPHRPGIDHEIPLISNAKPVYGPIYNLSETELQALKEYIDNMVAKGFIRPSKSPFGSPVLFVKKPDGSLRLCVDYRKLNDITIKNRYALPLISELFDRLKNAKYFTRLDMADAYNQLRIAEGDEYKTAFALVTVTLNTSLCPSVSLMLLHLSKPTLMIVFVNSSISSASSISMTSSSSLTLSRSMWVTSKRFCPVSENTA
jgi:hypothetical protein